MNVQTKFLREIKKLNSLEDIVIMSYGEQPWRERGRERNFIHDPSDGDGLR